MTPTPLILVLVALAGTPLVERPGGRALATAGAGVLLEQTGGARAGWIPVKTSGTVRLQGWVARDRLGCRVAEGSILWPAKNAVAAAAPPAPFLRAGALVRILGPAQDGELPVETTGVLIVRGWLRVPCEPTGPAYRAIRPSDFELRTLARPVIVGPPLARAPTRLAPGTRIVVEATGDTVRAYLDGPVRVPFELRAADLGPPPEEPPLIPLGQGLGYDFEVVAERRLERQPRAGREAIGVTVAGGTGIAVLLRRPGWVRVRTVGQIAAEGWLPDAAIHPLTTAEEEIWRQPPTPAERNPRDRGPRAAPRAVPDAGGP